MSRGEKDVTFMCSKCCWRTLPFDNEDYREDCSLDLESDASNTSADQPIEYECCRSKGLNVIHINTRSLVNKKDELAYLAERSSAAVLCVTETWLDETIHDAEVQLPGYTLQRKDRNREGGGVCMFIKNSLAFNRRSDLENEELELLACDILLPKTKPILIGVVYRPPKDNAFYQKLEIQLANCFQQECILLGDFNTNVNSQNTNSLIRSLDRFMKKFSFKQMIKEFTRITGTSATTIDLILVNDVEKISNSGVIPCSFSDHHIVYCTRKINRGYFGQHNVAKIRCMRNYDVSNVREKFKQLDWSNVLKCKSVNEAWCHFVQMFNDVIDEVAPYKKMRTKQRSKLWFSSEVLNLIWQRDQAQLKFRKSKNKDDYLAFKRLRNLTQRKIKILKREYIKNQLEENQSQPKKLWKNLKEIGMPTKIKNSTENIGLKGDNSENIVFEETFVANKLNNFFCNIAAKLTKNMNKQPFDTEGLTKFYTEKGVTPDNFKLTIVTKESVLKLLTNLNVTKSTGCDNISAKFLKDVAQEIVSPVTHIINLSITTGTVPDDIKTARVVPLYKKGDRNYEGNYRPVSILPVISKVFERLVYDQYYSYLCQGDLVYKYQSGFRKMFSTNNALTFLTDKIRYSMDNGLYTGVILLDLQKAFDTVDHDILLHKIRATGADENTVKWFTSYLCNRKQFVKLNNISSSREGIKCGVPQGSILGPLLFNIYVNDMCRAVLCDIFLYADDSMLVVSGKNVLDIEKTLECEMNKLSVWLESNKLSLHLGKTESILFGSKRKLKRISKMNILCNGVELEAKKQVKYLGATIDQDMSGKTMGSNIVTKINKGLKFMYRKGKFLTFKMRKLLCTAVFQSHFDYGCNVYYRGLDKQTRTKLQTAQNKIIRFILGYDCRRHLMVADFKKVKYLNVEKRMEYLTLSVMHRVFNDKAPSYLCNFQKVTDVHSYHTRNSEMCYVIPQVKTQGKLSFSYNGAKLWNSLPTFIKSLKSCDSFKFKCKAHLLDEMFTEERAEFLYYD